MNGLGLKLLKIHLLFLSFLPQFIDRTRDGKNGNKTRFYIPRFVSKVRPRHQISAMCIDCAL
jgi:hypothetical protein